jgi:hypothetical protein
VKLGPELLLLKEDLFQEDLLQNTPLTKLVGPVWQTGQTGFAHKSPKDQQGQKPSKRTPNATNLGLEDFLGKEQQAYQKSSRTVTVTKTG